MKKILSVLFLLCGMQMFAQGSLQFNQVLILENSTNNCTSCWTVPAGKVWKVEHVSSNSDGWGTLYLIWKRAGLYDVTFVFSQ